MIGQHQITNAGHHQRKNGNVQHSFSFLVHGSRPHSSNILPARHPESNPHNPAGQQLHAAGIHVEFANSFIVLHVWLSWYVFVDKVSDTQRLEKHLRSAFRRKQKNPNPSPIEKGFGFSILAVVLPVDIPTGWEPRTNKSPTAGGTVLFKSSYPLL